MQYLRFYSNLDALAAGVELRSKAGFRLRNLPSKQRIGHLLSIPEWHGTHRRGRMDTPIREQDDIPGAKLCTLTPWPSEPPRHDKPGDSRTQKHHHGSTQWFPPGHPSRSLLPPSTDCLKQPQILLPTALDSVSTPIPMRCEYVEATRRQLLPESPCSGMSTLGLKPWSMPSLAKSSSSQILVSFPIVLL